MAGRADFGRIQGVLPHDSPDATFPTTIGGRAKTSLPTAVADEDVVKTLHDVYGRLIVAFELAAVTSTTNGPSTFTVTNPTAQVVIASPALNTSIRVSSIYASNLDPTTNINLTLQQGGLTKIVSQLHTQGGGYVWSFEPAGWHLGSAQALTGLLGATSTSGIQVNVMWRQVPTPT